MIEPQVEHGGASSNNRGIEVIESGAPDFGFAAVGRETGAA
jgi:hypothetical protein